MSRLAIASSQAYLATREYAESYRAKWHFSLTVTELKAIFESKLVDCLNKLLDNQVK